MSEQDDEWPRTVEEAAHQLLDALTAEQKEKPKNTHRDDLIRYHMGLGTFARNALGLWQGNQELLDSCGKLHPDDASMIIIEAVWESLRKEP